MLCGAINGHRRTHCWLLRRVSVLAVESWPGLATLIIRNNAAEIHKRKAVDVNAFKLFRRLVAVAQDESRSGQMCKHAARRACSELAMMFTEAHAVVAGSSTLLLWRAAKLFTHVREVLTVATMSTVIGAEYAAVLRTHLLSTPSYCDCTKPEDAQGANVSCNNLPAWASSD